MDKISVIIPVYNVELYLEECVESVISQTYKNLEIILVDDGSQDRSGFMCDSYALKDRRIRVIHKANGGLSEARNTAIDICTGEFIVFVDSDDYIDKNYIELLFMALSQTKADIVYPNSYSRFIDGVTSPVFEKDHFYAKKVEKREALKILLYQYINITGAQAKLYRRECFDQIRFPAGQYFEDLATTYKLFSNSDVIAFANIRMYAYRNRATGIMREPFSKRKLSCITIAKELFQFYSDDQELRRAAASRALSINRKVLGQLPIHEKRYRNAIWNEIIKYRKYVINDPKARKKEKVLLYGSYLGRDMYYMMNHLREIYINRKR